MPKQKGKLLKTLYYKDEPFYGMSDTCTGQIEINVEFIWKLARKNEDKFYIKHEWNNRIKIKTKESNNKEDYIYKIDKEVWSLMRNIKVS